MDAQKEIEKTLAMCKFFIHSVGVSYSDSRDTNYVWETIKRNKLFIFSSVYLTSLISCLTSYVVYTAISPDMTIEDFISSFHNTGYALMSLGKLLTIWYKRDDFRRLILELAEIWPVNLDDDESKKIKRDFLTALRKVQIVYTFWNVLGVWIYNLTPVVLHIYRLAMKMPSDLGFVWRMSYPFDKTKPVYHELAYVFEMYGGCVSVWSMLGSDMLFTTMASHIAMLLDLLQVKIRNLDFSKSSSNQEINSRKCYKEIISVITIHQRLIKYYEDLEEAFSFVNLINVVLSSVNICCVMFTIVLLEPWMEISSKFFLGATLTQVGILCWYAHDIYRASIGIADAVYTSGWYKGDSRCRRALLVLLQRSQKPLYFTAFKFSPITMLTYTSIITKSYSYFALLYTVYKRD